MSLFGRVFGGLRNRRYARGIQHYNRREYAEAIAEFQELLSEVQDPSNPEVELARFYWAEAHVKLGQRHFRRGELALAREAFQQALLVEGSFPDLYFYLGVLSARERRSDEALALLDRAIELKPDYLEALAARALVFDGRNRVADADADLARLEALDIPVPETVCYQARPPLRTHVIEEAAAAAGERDVLAAALDWYDRGSLCDALSLLEQAVEAFPGYADLRWRRGLMLSELSRREEAVCAFDEALAINPDFVTALLSRGICLLCLGRPAEARQSLDRAAGFRPGYADIAYYQGVAALGVGDAPAALEALGRALSVNPRFWRARFVIGTAHLALGNRAEALRALREALDNQPAPLSERSTLVRSPDHARGHGGLDFLKQAAADHPRYPDLRVQLGLALLFAGNLEAARDEFLEAVRLNPEYVQAHVNLGKTALLAGNPDRAIESFRRALALDDGLTDVHGLLGESRLAAGDLSGSEAAFRRALELNPDYVDALLGLAALKKRQGETGEVERLYRRALSLEPGRGGTVESAGSRESAGGQGS